MHVLGHDSVFPCSGSDLCNISADVVIVIRLV